MKMLAAFMAFAGTLDFIDDSTQTEIEYVDESTQTDNLAANQDVLDLINILGIEYDNDDFFDDNFLEFALVGTEEEEEEEEDEDAGTPEVEVAEEEAEEEEEDEDAGMSGDEGGEEESTAPVFWLTFSIVVLTAIIVGAFLYFFLA